MLLSERDVGLKFCEGDGLNSPGEDIGVLLAVRSGNDDDGGRRGCASSDSAW